LDFPDVDCPAERSDPADADPNNVSADTDGNNADIGEELISIAKQYRMRIRVVIISCDTGKCLPEL
jgi:hypothetical protein